tara:strand:+ start:126 stop:506 length:381 start_codon:yes stop_codon:yes gene_type:complete
MMIKKMKRLLAALSVLLFANQASAETIYVLSTFYVNQSDLARYEKKWYSSTSISTDAAYYFKDRESCRSALKDRFLEDTSDPEKEVSSNEISDEIRPQYTLTYNNGGLFFHYVCLGTLPFLNHREH